jgi:hypothetical protein
VARLFLASDILHNSTAPVRNASRYRARLEDALPAIFESLQQTYRNAPGRMAQVKHPPPNQLCYPLPGSPSASVQAALHLVAHKQQLVHLAASAACHVLS